MQAVMKPGHLRSPERDLPDGGQRARARLRLAGALLLAPAP